MMKRRHSIDITGETYNSNSINDKYYSPSISYHDAINPNSNLDVEIQFTIITDESTATLVTESIVDISNNDIVYNNKDINNSLLDIIVESKDTGNQLSSLETKTQTPLVTILLLNVVTIIWGTQHAIIKQVLVDNNSNSVSTSDFTLARFMIALLLVVRYTPPLPFIGGSIFKRKDDDDADNNWNNILDQRKIDNINSYMNWRWGVELGIWMFLGYTFQAIGLQYTTAQKSGFLLYLNVKFVPFFAYLLFRRRITLPTWLCALTAVIGTYCLAYESSNGIDSLNNINVGDIWSLAAAAASAMFILRLECANKAAYSMTGTLNSSSLNATCLWTVTIASAIWCMLDSSYDSLSSPLNIIQSHPFALIYLGGVTTALANYIQTKAQKNISAERASIIYAMDPVYGAFFSYIILGETMGVQGYFGAFLISCAAIANALLDFGTRRVDED